MIALSSMHYIFRTKLRSILTCELHRALKLLAAPASTTSLSAMSKKALPTDLPIYSFSSGKEFEAFLDREHTTAPGIYLKLAKKSSGIPSVAAAEAVEIALCFGWIDGRANGLDDQWWLVRYTPRRQKSIWSQKNVNTIRRLLEEGRLRPAGVAAVEAAKADGRWERAYAGPATITVPDDLTTALAANPAAAAFFENMNKTDRYPVLFGLQTASPQNRAKRIRALVQMLAKGKQPGAPAKPTLKPKKSARQILAARKRPGGPTELVVEPNKSVNMVQANTSSGRSHYSLRTPRTNATGPNRPF